MSVNYKAIAMFGIRFQKGKQYYEFLDKNTKIKELAGVSDIDNIEDIKEFVKDNFSPLTITPVSMFETQEAILGFHVKIGETMNKYQEMWDNLFPNSFEKPSTFLEVITN
jgi:hypothetical protein